MISRILESLTEIDMKELCISVDVGEIIYPFSFIRDETPEYLIIDSTGDDGRERMVLVPKDKIISVNIVYQQDMDKLFEKKEEDRMFQ